MILILMMKIKDLGGQQDEGYEKKDSPRVLPGSESKREEF